MSSSANFKLILSRLAKMLVELGYQRKGTWFTKCPPDSRFFIWLNLRKILQITTKRTVFQVVSYAGIRPTAQSFAISSLAQVLSLSGQFLDAIGKEQQTFNSAADAHALRYLHSL